jgi:3-hydroxyisobutyrate dehydrogenase-like beta-hydroxyacid dehydrogenase
MKPQRIGILHPGEMGISIAASAKNSGHEVYWVSEGRGPATRERAAKFALRDAGSLTGLSAQCSIILSVCPPHAAESVANEVVEAGFNGIYVDANAISPRRTIEIGKRMSEAGMSFVDGGIIGLPAWKPGATRLYVSGQRAADVAACFDAGPLDARVLWADIGNASSLKMCYAAYSKGTTALLSAIVATAERLDVRDELFEQWKHDDPGFVDQAVRRITDATAKAWRWAPEMTEISQTFREAGVPGEFHAAAEVIYRRLAQFKDAAAKPTLEEIIAALLQQVTHEQSR